MADWTGQLIMARRQVTEIEKKIARQQQAVEQLRLEGGSTSQPARLLAVLQQSLARAKIHIEFIEHKITAEAGDADRRKARTVLVDSLVAKHQPVPNLAQQSIGVETPLNGSRPARRTSSARDNARRRLARGSAPAAKRRRF
jgi:hypothetical protein